MRIKSAAAPVVALIAIALSGTASAERWQALQSCELALPGTQITAPARCGELRVPENPAAPDGRQITLAYAVIPARGGRSQPDPVVFLAGGPGQSARDIAPLMRLTLREINRERDMIFLDQRGTGDSNRLDCDFSEAEVFVDPDWSAFSDMVRECKAGWDADVRFYTTTDGADDLEHLRAHHGIEQWNLIGGSYGTRMAQVYLRRYPERVRSVILDGVAPTRLALGSEHAVKLDQALQRLFAACAADAACGQRFPDLERSFEHLKARYEVGEQALRITHPRTGVAEELVFTRHVLGGALRFLAYQPQSQMKIPYLVHEAAVTDDPSRLASQFLLLTEQLEDLVAFGLNMTVGCSEDWPHWPRGVDKSDTLLGNTMDEMYATLCAWWPVGQVDPDFNRPFDADVPMLILSGELDPVTPPEYGDEAQAQFSNSVHLVGRGLGHIVLNNACFAGIAAQFIAAASISDLDTACMQRVGPEPFFLDLLGPAP